MNHQITLQTPDGFSLDALYSQGTNEKGIVFVHGISNDKYGEEPFIRAAEELSHQGFSTINFDLRAHGKSSGDSIKDYTITSQLVDIHTAVSYLKDHGVKTIFLAGASFGGAASCLYVEKYPTVIQALLLKNPVLDYDKAFLHPTTPWAKEYFKSYQQDLKEKGYVSVGSRQYKLGPTMFEEMKALKPYKALSFFSNDLYILQGDNDTILSYKDCVAIFEELTNQKKELKIVKGAEHGFHEEPYQTEATNLIVYFFVKK